MIPGTLRPLPKKLAKVKSESERLLRSIEYDYETTGEILKSSKNYEFEEVRNQYLRNIDYLEQIIPLRKRADKLIGKYSTDSLLRDMVFKLYTDLEYNEKRLSEDIQKLDTILMTKRKGYIEKNIPIIKSEITSKLSFLHDLDFAEIIANSSTYSDIISDIVSKVEIIKDEYNKLLSDSINKDMHESLGDKILELEDDLKEYVLILATCKMELLTKDSSELITKGKQLLERFKAEQTSELIEEGQEFLELALPTVKQMKELKLDIPKKAMKKSFEKQFNELRIKFEENKALMINITEELKEKTDSLQTNIERINAIKEYASGFSGGIEEIVEQLKIQRKGTFKLYIKENMIPYMQLIESGIIKLPKPEELTPEVIDQIIDKLAEIDKQTMMKDWFNAFRATKLGKYIYETSIKVAKWINDTIKKLIAKLKKNTENGEKEKEKIEEKKKEE